MRRQVACRCVVLGTVVPAAIAAALAASPVPVAANSSTVSILEGPPNCSTPSYCFTPANVTIAPGDTVVWGNKTDTGHTVTRCTASACSGTDPGTGSDSGPASGNVAQNASFSATFNGAGTYNYYCTVHGYSVMHGTVTVAAGGAAGGSAPTGADVPWGGAAAMLAAGTATVGGLMIHRRRRAQADARARS